MAMSYTVLLIIALLVLGLALYFFISNKQKLAEEEMKKQEDIKLMEQAKEEVKAVSLSAAPSNLEVKEKFTLEDDKESEDSSEDENVQLEQKETVVPSIQELEGVASSASMPAPFINL